MNARATTGAVDPHAEVHLWIRRVVASGLHAAPLALWSTIVVRAFVLAAQPFVRLHRTLNPIESPLLLLALGAVWWHVLRRHGCRTTDPSWLDRDMPLVGAGVAFSGALIVGAAL